MRRVRWTWSDEPSACEIDTDWHPIGSPHDKCADSFKIEIELSDEFLQSLPEGEKQLATRLVEIEPGTKVNF